MQKEILELIAQAQERGLSALEINKALPTTSLEELMPLLYELSINGELAMNKKQRYVLAKYQSIYRGKLRVNKKGFGFVEVEELENDVYISASKLNGAMEGDIVVFKHFPYDNEGEIWHIVEHGIQELIGTIRQRKRSGKFIAEPDSSKIGRIIELTNAEEYALIDGYKVQIKIENYEGSVLQGRILSIIGHEKEPGVDVLAKLMEYNVLPEFNEMVDKQVKEIPNKVLSYQRKGREDYRNIWTCTIDGDDSKDFDDAISIQRTDKGYELMVHIADVSYYVTPGSAIDHEAYTRGTSVYVVDRVVPMLPFPLSNGICSLNPNEERLTLTCVMQFSHNGELYDYSIAPSIIVSDERMTYSNVNKILAGDSKLQEQYENCADKFFIMEELASKIRYLHEERGSIDFDTTESKFKVDENGHVLDIFKRERGEAERIIEDFMISANECVASHMKHLDLPFIYRIHEQPEAKRIREFASVAKTLGYNFKGNPEHVYVKEFQRLLKQAEGKEEFQILSMFMLRCMSKARYDVNCVGHFGLASEFYTHFTSPIRRYPDLLVHRYLRKYLFEELPDNETLKNDREWLTEAALHASERERAAVDAERDVEAMKKAEFFEDKIGEIYEGTITSLTNFGMFIELANTVEGLVHISSLHDDYYSFDATHQELVGGATKRTFKLGAKIKIRVKNASKKLGTIDFEVVGGPRKRKPDFYAHTSSKKPRKDKNKEAKGSQKKKHKTSKKHK